MATTSTSRLADPARLAALSATALLDSPIDEAFDRYTRLLARVVEAPVALLTLVDDTRQFFKSAIGIKEWAATQRGTPLSHSFCQHVVNGDAPLIVEDAREHPLVRDNLAIRDLEAVAYAGYPIHAGDGQPLGSLCAIFPAPHVWTDDELAAIRDLAASASAEIGLRYALTELRASEAQMQDLVEHAGDMIIITTADTRLLYANQSWRDVMGPVAGSLLSVLPPERRSAFIEAGRRMMKGEAIPDFESELVAPNGERMVVQGDATPRFEKGRVTAMRLVFRDVTGERRADASRAATERLKDELIGIVSHEIRTPLGAIQGSLHLLDRGSNQAAFQPRERELIQMAVRNADRLHRLVDDLLDLERIRDGRMELELRAVAANEIIAASMESVGALAGEAGVILENVDSGANVMADPERITQVVTNLLGNAIKFTPRGKRIRVAISADPTQPHMVRISVQDEGRGIPADKLVAVFEPFVQVERGDGRRGRGAGLGLAISRAIVEQHGGKIWAESAPGAGTAMHFTVPAAPETTPDFPGSRAT